VASTKEIDLRNDNFDARELLNAVVIVSIALFFPVAVFLSL
jgi:hypothetical protein